MPEHKDLDSLLPRPCWAIKPQIREWAVGVTTAPRKKPTIEKCLVSLGKAGWSDFQVRLLSEELLKSRDYRVSCRIPTIGAWPNYYLGLWELVLRRPEADAYMMVQDDALFPDCNVREYLESFLWPIKKRIGAVSLYCAAPYATKDAGWHEIIGPRWTWGAVCMLWPRATVYQFLTSHQAINHRLKGKEDGLKNIDSVIGNWAQKAKLPVMYGSPSIVQHIGEVSSMWEGRNEVLQNERRFAKEWVGDMLQ